jgi:hypothetical protein
LKKDKERIMIPRKVHGRSQSAPVEKDMQEGQRGNAAKEPSGLCWKGVRLNKDGAEEANGSARFVPK